MQKKILAIGLISALSSTAMAEGMYLAIDVGQTTAKDACVDLPAGFTCNDKSTAFRFGGGYQFTPNFGIEATYGLLGTAKISGVLISAGTPIAMNFDVTNTTLQASAIGTLPLSENFSIFGKMGVASSTITLKGRGTAAGFSATLPERTKTKSNLAYGVGAQFNLTPKVGIRAQYENLGEVGDDIETPKVKLSLISAGLVVKF